MKIYTVLILPLVGILLFSCGKTKETAKDEAKVLRVAMELQYPPFEMASEDGTPTGISVETAYALGEFLERPVKIENISWTGLIPSIQTDKVDLILSSMTITEEREKVIDFSIPYVSSGLTLLINAESSVKNYEDLSNENIVVAVKSGTTGAIWAKDNIEKLDNIRIFDDIASCALEVSQGKADAFIYDALTTLEMQKKFPDSTMVNLESLPGTVGDWGIAVKKDNIELLEKINAFIREFRSSGGFEKLEQKYLLEIKGEFDKAGIPSFFDVKE